MSKKSSQRVALVLGSGGARGIAHIAAIETLEEEGFEITSIAGCSMGAVVGGIYAGGQLQEFKDWMTSLDLWKVFQLMDFGLSSKGFMKGEKVFKKIADFIEDTEIESLPIPYVAVASDIINRKPVVFKKGKLIDAIRASVSIPTVLEPKELDDTLLVDGGLVNPLPVNLVKRRKGDIVVAVDLCSHISVDQPRISKEEESRLEQLKKLFTNWSRTEKDKKKSMGMFDMMNDAFDLTQDTLSQVMLEKHSPDIHIKISREACGTMDFHKAEQMLKIGENATRKALKSYRKGSD